MTASDGSTALDIQIGGEHYKTAKIQPVQYIEANGLGFLEGCVVKRLARHNKPTGKGRQDIEKAIHELQLLLEFRYPAADLPCNNPVRAFHSDPMPEPAAAMEDDSERMRIIGQCGEMAEEVYAAIDASDPFTGAPEWAQWKAQDSDGCWHWYRDMPVLDDDIWDMCEGNRFEDCGAGKPDRNWRHTLIQRKQP